MSDDGDRIMVSVRLRPLNEKEIARNDLSEWECINDTTVILKSDMPDRSVSPAAFTFDRVFGGGCTTKQVYEEGAKEIAFSALHGINSSVFAYGQTSSGKTYTMTGITQYALADIFEYIAKHKEREFVLTFSAMEIYNEAVRDLLSSDSTPLRLLDDPERGTVVERLIEETVLDWGHLQELLAICEAQRKVGDTAMNETSSRSHQIIKLTVESSSNEHLRADSSSTLVATVNFVDLAGSERASQSLAASARLKEGSHINRSLLSLGTVIRKLSKGRNGHIPYRDSKLTRILQNSLGGNAKTAIICTMSPARSHVEQSRNTLLFASCAKQVTTNAQVNVLMSDKDLVKRLQKELIRLETQLRNVGSVSFTGDSATLLKEKELLIEQMNEEITELTRQLDLAQTHIDSLQKSVREDQLKSDDYSEVINPPQTDIGLARIKGRRSSDDPSTPDNKILQIPESPEDNFLLDGSTPKFFSSDPCHDWEDIAKINNEHEGTCKEVQCVDIDESIGRTKPEIDALWHGPRENEETLATTEEIDKNAVPCSREDRDLSNTNSDYTYDALKQKIQELHNIFNKFEQSPLLEEGGSASKDFLWTRSRSRRSVLVTIPSSLWFERKGEIENLPFTASDKDENPGDCQQNDSKLDHDSEVRSMSRKNSQKDSEKSHSRTSSEESELIKEIDVDVEDTASVIDFVPTSNQRTDLQPEVQTGNFMAPEPSTQADESTESTRDTNTERAHDVRQQHANWFIRFERYRKKIIELWARCNVPLVHRSYFFLLFKGDPSDNVYMEVELRRLYFLKDTSSRGSHSIIDGKVTAPTSSLKALSRERQILAKQIQKKYAIKEREELFQNWGIDLGSKQRSLQLARRLWTDTKDMKHIKESAVLVAKLGGFVEPRYAPKELFGLSFATPNLKPSTWKDNMSSLSLI